MFQHALYNIPDRLKRSPAILAGSFVAGKQRGALGALETRRMKIFRGHQFPDSIGVDCFQCMTQTHNRFPILCRSSHYIVYPLQFGVAHVFLSSRPGRREDIGHGRIHGDGDSTHYP